MPAFTSFSDQLPDPNYKINDAGAQDSSGSPGPGFAKIKFSSSSQIQVSRTISGRGVAASPGYHMWEFSITYNPMTRSEFEPVATFLEQRRGGRLYPFYVVLPQHAKPQDPTFNSFLTTAGRKTYVGWYHSISSYSVTSGVATLFFADTKTVAPYSVGDQIGISATISGVPVSGLSGTTQTVTEVTTTYVRFTTGNADIGVTSIFGNVRDKSGSIFAAGRTTLPIRGGNASTSTIVNISGNPRPGDFFTISDDNDTNHKKVYKVVRVETADTYQQNTLAPNTSQRRIHFIPPLTRPTTRDAEVIFINPRFRVVQKSDTIEYDLDTDNLYQFSINLEEILP